MPITMYVLIPYGQMLDHDAKFAEFCFSAGFFIYLTYIEICACVCMYVCTVAMCMHISTGKPLFCMQQVTILQHKLIIFTTDASFLILRIVISILISCRYNTASSRSCCCCCCSLVLLSEPNIRAISHTSMMKK